MQPVGALISQLVPSVRSRTEHPAPIPIGWGSLRVDSVGLLLIRCCRGNFLTRDRSHGFAAWGLCLAFALACNSYRYAARRSRSRRVAT